ncbi:putative coiled-coil domain-containing protein 129 [Scophthalmus maximus]|uniref:Putative coiled-coil domain-containing protein 129 n=1 Tax=Scophthalmus maximus TaxID=52904 RepID=A0A2U9CXH0_SCOMX|nr:putative coiled-coil domain-containing protein 129 [Scophthalmus maximus]
MLDRVMTGSRNVMDVLNLWNEDPEELLLDLGFGCDEPDLSGRIPARFINYQSQARGINLQVFLEAQENRLDLENPDVSHRFRQLEVLQQVTTTLRSLVVSSSSTSVRARVGKTLPPEARERRRRIVLWRRIGELVQTLNYSLTARRDYSVLGH